MPLEQGVTWWWAPHHLPTFLPKTSQVKKSLSEAVRVSSRSEELRRMTPGGREGSLSEPTWISWLQDRGGVRCAKAASGVSGPALGHEAPPSVVPASRTPLRGGEFAGAEAPSEKRRPQSAIQWKPPLDCRTHAIHNAADPLQLLPYLL